MCLIKLPFFTKYLPWMYWEYDTRFIIDWLTQNQTTINTNTKIVKAKIVKTKSNVNKLTFKGNFESN